MMPNPGRRFLLVFFGSLSLLGVWLLHAPISFSPAVAERVVLPAHSPPALVSHDFGKVVNRAGTTLDHVFTVQNDRPHAVSIEQLRGLPPCCVALGSATKPKKEIQPGESFDVRMRVRTGANSGKLTWRGVVALANDEKPFFLEASADLVPAIYVAWNDEARPELNTGEEAAQSAFAQFVGASGPKGLSVVSSDPDAVASIGALTARGNLEGTTYRAWQAPISVQVRGRKPGPHDAVVQVRTTSGDAASLSLKWTVRSEWIVEPKVLVVGANESVGRFKISPRRRKSADPPILELPHGLSVKVERNGNGFNLLGSRSAKSGHALETFKLTLGDETIPLSVVYSQNNDVAGEAKP